MDFFQRIFNSSFVLFLVGFSSSSVAFRGVTTLLKIACRHDPPSKLREDPLSSDELEDFGLLPTFRNLKTKMYIKLFSCQIIFNRFREMIRDTEQRDYDHQAVIQRQLYSPNIKISDCNIFLAQKDNAYCITCLNKVDIIILRKIGIFC